MSICYYYFTIGYARCISGKQEGTMTRRPLLIAGLLFCLVGLLALPAAASAAGGKLAGLGEGAIDPGLKDELWNIHAQHRLNDYEYHIEAAGDTIEALERYGYDTDDMSATLSEISAMHDTLETALNERDREELKSINTDLRHLWKEYFQELRQLLKGD